MFPSPPPSLSSPRHSSSSSMNLHIPLIAILGIITTAAFLLTYYVFVLKCCLRLRRTPNSSLLHATAPRPSSSSTSGLDPATISSIPTFVFTPSPFSPCRECAVCLADIRPGERFRLLPVCSHAFHIDCVDTWLQSCASCPICRTVVSIIRPPDEQSVAVASELNDEEEQRKKKPKKQRKAKKLYHAASMGDEGVEERGKGEWFDVQGLRRSLSLDSSGDRHVVLSVQEMLRRIGLPENWEVNGRRS